MSIDKDLIHRLVLEEMAGVISDEDQVYLKQIICEDPEALNEWMETRSILNTPNVKEFLDSPGTIENIIHAPYPRKNFNIWASTLGAAVVILIAGTIIYGILWPSIIRPVTRIVSNKHISLQLPDGETVDLSIKKGPVHTDAITLNNTNKALTYTTGIASPKIATLTIPPGKDYSITLNDGTQIWLNSTTILQFPLAFTGNTREITINGEAYLEVTKNVKPFFIHLPNGTIQVLGTAFNVNTYDVDKVQIALISGAVKMKRGKDSLLLQPGHEATYSPQGVQISTFDPSTLLSWRQGLHIFNNTPLSEVLQVLPRWFGMKVIMDNPAKRNSRFTGVIDRNKAVSTSLDILKATNDFDYYIDGDIIHIK